MSTGLLAGNALAVHDLEAALFQTALGQEIYCKRPVHLGHYHHLDALNLVRRAGSMAAAMETGLIANGVMHALWQQQIPYVLAGSIRDDGPLPEVITDVMQAQDAMRALASRATTVIAVATQLHSIAAGNMIPVYQVLPDGQVRPVYFYVVDMSRIRRRQTGQPRLPGRPGNFDQRPGFSGDFGERPSGLVPAGITRIVRCLYNPQVATEREATVLVSIRQ